MHLLTSQAGSGKRHRGSGSHVLCRGPDRDIASEGPAALTAGSPQRAACYL